MRGPPGGGRSAMYFFMPSSTSTTSSIDIEHQSQAHQRNVGGSTGAGHAETGDGGGNGPPIALSRSPSGRDVREASGAAVLHHHHLHHHPSTATAVNFGLLGVGSGASSAAAAGSAFAATEGSTSSCTSTLAVFLLLILFYSQVGGGDGNDDDDDDDDDDETVWTLTRCYAAAAATTAGPQPLVCVLAVRGLFPAGDLHPRCRCIQQLPAPAAPYARRPVRCSCGSCAGGCGRGRQRCHDHGRAGSAVASAAPRADGARLWRVGLRGAPGAR